MIKHTSIDKNNAEVQLVYHCCIENCKNPIEHKLNNKSKYGYNIKFYCDEHYKKIVKDKKISSIEELPEDIKNNLLKTLIIHAFKGATSNVITLDRRYIKYGGQAYDSIIETHQRKDQIIFKNTSKM